MTRDKLDLPYKTPINSAAGKTVVVVFVFLQLIIFILSPLPSPLDSGSKLRSTSSIPGVVPVGEGVYGTAVIFYCLSFRVLPCVSVANDFISLAS
jgi:hypothetical protein